jgi:hypothetical protein
VGTWLTGEPPRETWGEVVVRQAVVGAVFFWLFSWMVRRAGGPDAARLAQRSIREKRLPSDADPQVVATALSAHRQLLTRTPWLVGIGALLFAVLLVYLAVQLGDGVLWAVAGAMVAVAAGFPFLVRHRLRLLDRLLAEAEAAGR